MGKRRMESSGERWKEVWSFELKENTGLRFNMLCRLYRALEYFQLPKYKND